MLFSGVLNDEECDATGDANSTLAGYIKKMDVLFFAGDIMR